MVVNQAIHFIQSQIESTLDMNLLHADSFRPNLQWCRLVGDVVRPIINIFKYQSRTMNIQIQMIQKFGDGPLVLIDKVRT